MSSSFSSPCMLVLKYAIKTTLKPSTITQNHPQPSQILQKSLMQLNHTINSLSNAEKPIQNLVFKSYGCPKLVHNRWWGLQEMVNWKLFTYISSLVRKFQNEL